MSDRLNLPAPAAPARLDRAQRLRRAASRKRGTVLLMVVGVLALLAIIAVAYATLGRADRSASATLVQQQRSDLQVATVADYFASVIADSTFARYTEPNFFNPNSNTQPTAVTGAFEFTRGYTYPATDEYFLSIPIDAAILNNSGINLPAQANRLAQYTRFNPTGDNPEFWKDDSGTAQLLDPREFGDPFLAASRPTYVNLTPTGADQVQFLPSRLRDWAHISNFAPSGNFINLANFRPEHGGFAAKHGFGFAGQLSYGLTLFNPASGIAIPVTGTQTLPGRPARLDDPANPPPRVASPLVPSHWTTDQLWAFRPAFDFTHQPTQFEYLLNQWADTDGDGFVDSRWFMLDRIENFDPATNDAIVRSVVPTGSRLRYVFAARAVDNSSMLNVNVHTDFLNGPLTLNGVGPSATIPSTPPPTPPTTDDFAPPGLTPADIDLARLLTMRDAFNDARNNWNLPATGIAGFPNGTSVNDTARDYTFNPGGAPGARTAADLIGRSSFAALENMRRTGSSRATGIYDVFERHELDLATPPPTTTDYTDGVFRRDRFELETLSAALNNDARQTRRDTNGSPGTLSRISGVFGLDDELELRTFWGVNNPDTRSSLEVALGGRSSDNLFRNYSPLRDTRSLGIETLGRDATAAQLFPTSADPGAEQKRTLMSVYADVRQFLTTTSGARPIKDPGVALTYAVEFPQTAALPPISGTPNDFENRRLRAEAASTGAPLTDVLVSRPDVTTLLNEVQRFAEQNAQTPKTTRQVREFVEFAATGNGLLGGNTDATKAVVYQLFELYANALMPYTHRTFYPGAWQFVEPTTDPKIKHYINGLAYGGSPELALRMAAHMAVNLVDAFDRDRPTTGSSYDRHTPMAVTLMMAENVNAPTPPRAVTGNSLPAISSPVEDIERAYPHPQLKLHPTERLPATRNQNGQGLRMARRDANNASGRLTVYGVEPQPFLVEVAAFGIYTDAPEAVDGDMDQAPAGSGPGGNPTSRTLQLRQPTAPPDAEITIRFQPSLTRADFLGEILAFKLHNPFDVVVTLFDDRAPAGQDKAIYYLEYANRYYAFCPTAFNSGSGGSGLSFRPPSTSTGRIDLWPGETLTFYAINPGTLDQLWTRFRNAIAAAPPSVLLQNIGDRDTTLKDWLALQFGDGTRPNGRIDIFDRQLTPIYPDSLQPIVPANRPSFRAFGPQDEVDIFGETFLPGVNGSSGPTAGGTPRDLETAQPVERKIAHLWRVMRTEISSDPRGTATEGDLNSASVTQFNDPTNDLLADRLRDPTGGSSDAKLFEAARLGAAPGLPSDFYNQKVKGTEAGDETSTTPKDNTGYTAIIWAAIRRPTDLARVSGGTLETSNLLTRGVLPPWCMERRSDHSTNSPNADGTLVWNDDAGSSGGIDGAGKKSDFLSGQNNRFTSMRDFITSTAAASPTAKAAMNRVSYKTIAAIQRLNDGTAPKAFRQVAVEYHGVGETPDGLQTLNPTLFSRSTDFLLPLGIGPVYDPSIDVDASVAWSTGGDAWHQDDPKIKKRELQWLTLAEAIALSCGYFSPAEQDDVLRDFAREEIVGSGIYSSNYPSRAKTDRGHLRLDAFTPYLDLDGPAGDPAQPIGAGVPFALSVIDQFRSAAGISTRSELVNGTDSWPRTQRYTTAPGGGTFNPRIADTGSLVPGLMNINTVSTIPMRQIPMLAPDTSDDSWMRKAISARTSVFSEAMKPPPNAPATTNVANWDVATTIEAYRDRRDVFDFRFDDATGTQPLATANASPLRFREFTRDQHSRIDFNDMLTTDGRGIQRQARGIKSLGELVSINVRDNPATPGSIDPFWTGSMFALAPERDPTTASTTFAESRIAGWSEISGSTFLNRNAQGQATLPITRRGMQVDESYADKLAIAAALTNTTSVRSDIFTIYFLVHGYSPEDIEAVDGKPEEPLIPSVAKRYVMVLDRSNVVAAGDKPKVLMLREVPVR